MTSPKFWLAKFPANDEGYGGVDADEAQNLADAAARVLAKPKAKLVAKKKAPPPPALDELEDDDDSDADTDDDDDDDDEGDEKERKQSLPTCGILNMQAPDFTPAAFTPTIMRAKPTAREAARDALAKELGLLPESAAYLDDRMLLAVASARLQTKGKTRR
jgi:hypothetical protein